MTAHWHTLDGPDGLPLRCWWALPTDRPPRAAVLVLPEVFGVNGWVRSVADRLAAEGFAALALPIFARTALDLELGYDEAGLVEGRRHRDAVTVAGFLADVGCAIRWLQAQPGLEGRPVGCVGFCFGGHLAMLAATLPEVAATCDAYGARVSCFRPASGAVENASALTPSLEPTLAEVPRIPGHLLCLAGDADPLMPPEELAAIAAALEAASMARPGGPERRLMVLPGAGHGFMCEARADFQPEAAAQAWAAMLALFRRVL
ncbi:MAG: dienelactone hydrolase family protein [Cyanobacteria bacterium M_surface_10_m2_119]|nr:dienelactone hydrolase family protein [Cyanobacteria bacterium M_surface_10_m2_119]